MQTRWIHSAAFDFVFFSGFWILPAFALVYLNISSIFGAAVFFGLYHLLLRLPHFLATSYATYLHPGHQSYFRLHWIRFYLIPCLILITYSGASFLSPTGLAYQALLTLALVWGLEHIAGQHYGILTVYHIREDRRPNAAFLADRKIEKQCFRLLFGLSVISVVVSIWTDPQSTGVMALKFAARLSFGASVLYYLIRQALLSRTAQSASWPRLTYFVSAAASMFYWPFYDSLDAGRSSVLYFYVYNAQHCLSYLGLIYFMHGKRREPVPGLLGFFGFARFVKFMTPLVLLSCVLMAIVLRSPFPDAQVVIQHSLFRSYDILQGLFVVHYYLESAVWKFSNSHFRNASLPLLGRLEPVRPSHRTLA